MMPGPFTVRAEDEYYESYAYHLARGRAAAFDRAVGDAASRVAADPGSLPLNPGSDRFRRSPVRGFPYDLLFELLPSGPQVLSV